MNEGSINNSLKDENKEDALNFYRRTYNGKGNKESHD